MMVRVNIRDVIQIFMSYNHSTQAFHLLVHDFNCEKQRSATQRRGDNSGVDVPVTVSLLAVVVLGRVLGLYR